MKKNGEQTSLKYFIQPGMVVFDLGANDGEYSRHALAATKNNIELYAFEPGPETFKTLTKKMSHYQNVQLFQVALAEQKGEQTFFYYNKNSKTARLSSLVQRNDQVEKQLGKTTKITVQTDALDSFCAEHNVPEIGLLKIDTEGAELAILRGAQAMLAQQQIAVIQFEYGGCFKDGGTTLKELYELLTQYNYTIFRIVPKGLIHVPKWRNALENYTYSNYLALSPDVYTEFMQTH